MNYRTIYTSPRSWSCEETILLDEAVCFTNSYCGDNFFNDVCSFVSNALGVKFVLVGKLTSDAFDEVQTLGFACQGQPLPQHKYLLQNTPCENALLHHICFYPQDVQEIFSENVEFAALGIQSYMGVALNNATEDRLGLMAIMHDKVLENSSLVETFITILSPRIEEEMQRLQQPEHVGEV